MKPSSNVNKKPGRILCRFDEKAHVADLASLECHQLHHKSDGAVQMARGNLQSDILRDAATFIFRHAVRRLTSIGRMTRARTGYIMKYRTVVAAAGMNRNEVTPARQGWPR